MLAIQGIVICFESQEYLNAILALDYSFSCSKCGNGHLLGSVREMALIWNVRAIIAQIGSIDRKFHLVHRRLVLRGGKDAVTAIAT